MVDGRPDTAVAVLVPRCIQYAFRISRLRFMDGEKVPVCASELGELARYICAIGSWGPGGVDPAVIEARVREGTASFAGHRFKVL